MYKIFSPNQEQERGVVLFFTILVLAVFLGIALGVASLLLGGFKGVQASEQSLAARAAADAGIEHLLYRNKQAPCDEDPICLKNEAQNVIGTQTLSNGATYMVIVEEPGEGSCAASTNNYCAEATGRYQDTIRKIEVTQ